MTLYVRKDMLDAMPPPVSQRGVIGWLQENLFDGFWNSVLTVLAALTLVWFLNAALPWLLHSVWWSGSYLQCLDIIHQAYGPEASGACWAVIHERWGQYLFGFYPVAEWWRPILCFGLMLVAMVAPLFSDDARSAQRLIGPVAVLTLVLMAEAIGADAADRALPLRGGLAVVGRAADRARAGFGRLCHPVWRAACLVAAHGGAGFGGAWRCGGGGMVDGCAARGRRRSVGVLHQSCADD